MGLSELKAPRAPLGEMELLGRMDLWVPKALLGRMELGGSTELWGQLELEAPKERSDL
jgi:hypothetical protein